MGVQTNFIGYQQTVNAPKLTAPDLNAAFGRCAVDNPITHAPLFASLTGYETVGFSKDGVDVQVPLSVLLAMTGTSPVVSTAVYIVDDYGNDLVDDFGNALASP